MEITNGQLDTPRQFRVGEHAETVELKKTAAGWEATNRLLQARYPQLDGVFGASSFGDSSPSDFGQRVIGEGLTQSAAVAKLISKIEIATKQSVRELVQSQTC